MDDQYEIRQLSRDQLGLLEALWLELKQHHHERTRNFSEYYSKNTFERRRQALLVLLPSQELLLTD